MWQAICWTTSRRRPWPCHCCWVLSRQLVSGSLATSHWPSRLSGCYSSPLRQRTSAASCGWLWSSSAWHGVWGTPSVSCWTAENKTG
ncbi:hypothetical protein ACFFX0_21640 [Citricoccus parietis]|uniref:Secreted protein n=1 Tax=Citricoccus parietis TaxID=592307 RepID=A0ABV5G403_9MICC